MLSDLAAQMKSFMCKPLILCDHHSKFTFPHSSVIFGWWSCASAKSAFDSAWASYKGIISSNKDAALMYTYANVFAMQIDQINY